MALLCGYYSPPGGPKGRAEESDFERVGWFGRRAIGVWEAEGRRGRHALKAKKLLILILFLGLSNESFGLFDQRNFYVGVDAPVGSLALGLEGGLDSEGFSDWAKFIVDRQSLKIETRYKPWNDLTEGFKSSLGLALEAKFFVIGKALSGLYLGVHTMLSWAQYSGQVYDNGGYLIGHETSNWGFAFDNKVKLGYQWHLKRNLVLSSALALRFYEYEWVQFEHYRQIHLVAQEVSSPRESLEFNIGWEF